MNSKSQPLQQHEITLMKGSPLIMERILMSYKMMLDFFGMRLVSLDQGLLERVLPPKDYTSRYRNLIRTSLDIQVSKHIR